MVSLNAGYCSSTTVWTVENDKDIFKESNKNLINSSEYLLCFICLGLSVYVFRLQKKLSEEPSGVTLSIVT